MLNRFSFCQFVKAAAVLPEDSISFHIIVVTLLLEWYHISYFYAIPTIWWDTTDWTSTFNSFFSFLSMSFWCSSVVQKFQRRKWFLCEFSIANTIEIAKRNERRHPGLLQLTAFCFHWNISRYNSGAIGENEETLYWLMCGFVKHSIKRLRDTPPPCEVLTRTLIDIVLRTVDLKHPKVDRTTNL